MINWAKGEGYFNKENPFSKFKLLKSYISEMVVSDDEYKLLLKESEYLDKILLVSLDETTSRLGELINAQWEMADVINQEQKNLQDTTLVDLRDGNIYIVGKTGQRKIKMSPILWDALEQLKGKFPNSDRVFPYPQKNPGRAFRERIKKFATRRQCQ